MDYIIHPVKNFHVVFATTISNFFGNVALLINLKEKI